MDISSARLTSLLREALTPEPLPSAKADPVKTALVKALVAPPAPPPGASQPVAAALPSMLPAVVARVQQQLILDRDRAGLSGIDRAGRGCRCRGVDKLRQDDPPWMAILRNAG